MTNYLSKTRNENRANEAINKIKKDVPSATLHYINYDQSNFKLINQFINNIKNIDIDVLILNAGILKSDNKSLTTDGHPLVVGTNYIGLYYLFTNIDSLIKEKKIKQIILVTSIARLFAGKKYIDCLTKEKNHSLKDYCASKKMIYQFAGILKYKYPELKVSLMHPGISMTRLVNEELHSFPKLFHRFGTFILKLFSNTQEKSALAFFSAINNASTKNIVYSRPQGLFHIKGYPTYSMKYESKIKNNKLEEYSKKLIN